MTTNQQNALVSISEQDAALLQALTGETQQEQKQYFPKLGVVQKTPVDDEGTPVMYNGKPVKLGTFSVSLGEQTVYADSITLRILAVREQIMKVDPKTFKPLCQSIYFENWGQELIDNKGGIACGRVFGKATKSMDKDAVAQMKKDAPAYMHVFGLVTVDGFEQPQLVHWRLRGNGYFACNTFIQNTFSPSKPYQMYNVKVTTRKEQGDGTVFYVPVFEADFSTPAPFDMTVRDAAAAVLSFIDEQNGIIRDDHLKARSKKNRGADTDAIAAKLVEPIDDDLVDVDVLDDGLDGLFPE